MLKEQGGTGQYYKIESIGEKFLDKTSTNKTEYTCKLIEDNMELLQFLRPQIEQSFLNLIENLYPKNVSKFKKPQVHEHFPRARLVSRRR